MSGRKTVEISTYDYDTLRRKASSADSAARSIAKLKQTNRALDAMNKQQAQRMNRETARLESRISEIQRRSTQESQALRRQLAQDVAAVRQQIDRQAAINARNMDQMRRAFEAKLSMTDSRIADLTRTVEENHIQAQQDILNMKTEVDKSIKNVTSRLDAADANAKALLECAETYLDAADQIIESAKAFRCAFLLPKEWNALLADRKRALEDITLARQNAANSAVARSSAQTLSDEALAFYNAIIAAEQEWQVHYEAARQQLALANAKLTDSENVRLNDEEFNVDVCFWGNHELNGIAESLSQAEETLREQKDCLTVDDLDGLASLGSELRQQTEEAVVHAVGAVYGSQERIETAAAISDILYEEFGLHVEEHSYRSEDQRCAYRFRAKNPVTAYELIVTLSPVPKEDGTIGMECECETVSYGDNDSENASRIAHQIGTAVMKEITGNNLSSVQTDHTFDKKPSDRPHMKEEEWKIRQLTRQELPDFRGVKRTADRRSLQTAE